MLKSLIATLLAAAVCAPAMAQSEKAFDYQAYRTDDRGAERAYNKAIYAMRSGQYDEAIRHLKESIDEDPKYLTAYVELGRLYNHLGRYAEQAELYERVIRIEPRFNAPRYSLGNIYYTIGRYERGKQHLDTFLSRLPADADSTLIRKSKRTIAACNFAIQAKENPTPFEPERLGSGVNTTYDEYMPVLTADGRTLMFTRSVRKSLNSPRVDEDIYYTTHNGTEWRTAEPLPGNVNSDANEGTISVTPDGLYMILARCPAGRHCALYASKKQNDRWMKPIPLPEPVNDFRTWTSQPSLSYDGQTLYFAGNRPGGYGGADVWKTTFDPKNGGWTRPVNMGETINTDGDDKAPFIHNDNRSLYFSSDGHLGLGQADLFKAVLDSAGNVDTVINLGYPVNSHLDERSIMISTDGEQAFFAKRNPDNATIDIYAFKPEGPAKPETATYLRGIVYDSTAPYKKPLEADFQIVDLRTGEVAVRSRTPESGEFQYALPADREYLINVSRRGYLFYSDNLDLRGYSNVKPYEKDIPLVPVRTDMTLTLRNIFYQSGKYQLLPKSKSELKKLINFLTVNPKVSIQIEGHTDSIGSDQANQTLSENRAKAVRDYLTQNGIAADRLSFKGFGESEPVAPNSTPEGRARNRRTEVRILKTD